MSTSDPLSGLIEEQAGRIHDLYQKKSKSFRMALYGLGGFVAIFFVLVFYPYVSFRGEQYRLEDQLSRLRESTSALNTRRDEIRVLARELGEYFPVLEGRFSQIRWREFEEDAEDQAKQLDERRLSLIDDPEAGAWARGEVTVPALSDAFFRRHGGLGDLRDDRCAWLADQAWMRCRLAGRLGEFHRQAVDPLRHSRRSHLRNELFVPIAADLDPLDQSFRAWLLGDAPSWRGDEAEPADPRGELRRFGEAYLKRVNQGERDLLEELSRLDGQIHALGRNVERRQAELDLVQRQLKEMEGLQQIETPFGQLPLGLNEMVLIFPVFLAAGLLVCATLLSETMLLRRVLYGLWKRKDPSAQLLSNEMVALVAPLWIDPLHGARRRLGRLLLLAGPALVFAVSIALLVYNRLLWGDFMREARLNLWIYGLLYVVSVGLILQGGRRVLAELRAHRGSSFS